MLKVAICSCCFLTCSISLAISSTWDFPFGGAVVAEAVATTELELKDEVEDDAGDSVVATAFALAGFPMYLIMQTLLL